MVEITLNKKSQKIVTPYEGNPKFGFIQLKSVEQVIHNNWLQMKERTTILKGEFEKLESAFQSVTTLAGKIAVTECTEDNIPVEISSQFNKTQDFEEQIKGNIKRAGENGPVLVQDDKRILRFTNYDATGLQNDVRVPHTNVEEIRAYNATLKAKKSATLPK